MATYLVMELVEGETLNARIKAAAHLNRRLKPRQVVAWMQEIGAALSVCHQQGLAHRDVKPQNIVIEEKSGQAVLIDFGLTKLRRPIEAGSFSPDLTASGAMIGTPAFMAPEQFIGEEHGTAGDVWSWTATLFYALTNEQAFPGQTIIDIYQAMDTRSWPREALNRTRLQAYAPICNGGFTRDPERRPGIDALLDLLESTSQAPPEPRAPKLRWALIASLILAPLLLLGGLVWRAQPREAPRGPEPPVLEEPASEEPREAAPILGPEERALDAALRALGVIDARPWLPLSSAKRWETADEAERRGVRERVADRLGPAFDGLEDEAPTPGFPRSRPMVFRHRASGLEFLLIPGGTWDWDWYPRPELGALHSYLSAMAADKARPEDLGELLFFGPDAGALLDELAQRLEDENPEAGGPTLSELFARAPDPRAVLALRPRLAGLAQQLRASPQVWALWRARFQAEAEALAALAERSERVVLPFLLARIETTCRDYARTVTEIAPELRLHPGPIIISGSLEPWLRGYRPSGFRLPTRLEWRHAASNGDPILGPWGGPEEQARSLQWSAELCLIQGLMMERGAFTWTEHEEARNRFGLIDLLGNMEERVAIDIKAWAEAMRRAGRMSEEEIEERKESLAELELLAGGHQRLGFALCRADFVLHNARRLLRPQHGFRVAISLFEDR